MWRVMIDGYMVYWFRNNFAEHRLFTADEMSLALQYMAELRFDPLNQFVTFASQNSNSVGSAGVDSIKNGILPDGHQYDWTKRR
jgi:hypothetical protein